MATLVSSVVNYIFGADAQKNEREVEDKDAKAFDEKALIARAMKVHKFDDAAVLDVNNNQSLKVTREEVEGVPEAFLLHNVLTEEECKRFMEITEHLGFTDAPISTGLDRGEMVKDIRDNLRVMWEASPALVQILWERVKPLLEPTVSLGNPSREWKLSGLNERFRFYRYDKEQSFKPHFDGCFRRSYDEQTHYTFIIYLNDGFEGGETTFFPGGVNSLWARRVVKQEKRVNPKMGTALLFRHTGSNSPLHEGTSHFSDGMRKYVLRSDVMYTVTEPSSHEQNEE